MRRLMLPDLRADYKIRLYTRPKNPFFEVSNFHDECDSEPIQGRVSVSETKRNHGTLTFFH